MPTATRPPRLMSEAERRAEVEGKLLAATERLLADGHGFASLSVEQLASEAGIARSTFYVYFADRNELVIRLGTVLVEQLAGLAAEWWTLGEAATRGQLERTTRRVVGVYAEHAAAFAALTESAAADPRLREVQELLLDYHAAPLRELLAAPGTRDLPVEETAVAILAMVEGACYRLARGAGEAELDRLAGAISAIVWHALFEDGRR